MPCTYESDEPTSYEIAFDQVRRVLKELDGKTPTPIKGPYRYAYMDMKSYADAQNGRRDATDDKLDKLVDEACRRLTAHQDVKSLSLETQLWWRDHQIADAKRNARLAAEAKRHKIKNKALSKLSPEERKALGVAK